MHIIVIAHHHMPHQGGSSPSRVGMYIGATACAVIHLMSPGLPLALVDSAFIGQLEKAKFFRGCCARLVVR